MGLPESLKSRFFFGLNGDKEAMWSEETNFKKLDFSL